MIANIHCNIISEYHLPLIKLFTVNNSYFRYLIIKKSLQKVFTINRIIYR